MEIILYLSYCDLIQKFVMIAGEIFLTNWSVDNE